ncbi:MAG: ATP-binding cassette domain-containing protein [Firmicutes bacterium]|nr:ATP-binding cassette domain-containing protein [Bacillota bacterium]
MPTPLLKVENLKKYFVIQTNLIGQPTLHLKATDGVSFELEEGKTLGVVGESGCGKTTMGRAVLRLWDVDGGRVVFNGERIDNIPKNQMRKYRTQMQIIFQDPYSSLPPRMNVGSIISEAVHVHGLVGGKPIGISELIGKYVISPIAKFVVNPIVKICKSLIHKVRYKLCKKYQARHDVLEAERLRDEEEARQLAEERANSPQNEEKKESVGSQKIIDETKDLKRPFFRSAVYAENLKRYTIEVMRECGLQPHFYERYPNEFSGGQRQRICIARALAVKPRLVVCDEPVSALDVSIQAQIINLLEDLQENFNLSFIFISHDLSVVHHISNDVAVMYLGSIVEKGPKVPMFKNPLHPYTKVLLDAVPDPDPRAKKEKSILRGDVPTPINMPKGCKFCTRCPHVLNVCHEIRPELVEIEPEHFVACHLHYDYYELTGTEISPEEKEKMYQKPEVKAVEEEQKTEEEVLIENALAEEKQKNQEEQPQE